MKVAVNMFMCAAWHSVLDPIMCGYILSSDSSHLPDFILKHIILLYLGIIYALHATMRMSITVT